MTHRSATSGFAVRDSRPHACVFTFHRLPDMRIFDRQVRALLRAGYRVTLIGRSDRRPYAGVGVNDIMVPDRAGGVWRRIVTLLRIARHALQTEADVYHLHDPDLLPVGVLVRALRGRPVVYDIHEIYRVKFQLKAQRSPLLARLITAAFACVEDVCARLIGHCSCVYEESVEHFSRLGCRCVLTPNYASRAIYADREPTDAEWAARSHKLVYVGVVNALRGALVMIEAARRAREHVPDLELIVTRRFYKPSDEKPVMELLARPGYENLVHWVPDTPGDELPAVVRQAAVGLSPLQDVGQYRLAVPSKFFDYMAESCAILASDLPPSRKYVGEVGCGVLVPPADVDAWAGAMVTLLSDPDRTRVLGRVGRAAFLERFNWEAYEPAFVRFYDELSQVRS